MLSIEQLLRLRDRPTTITSCVKAEGVLFVGVLLVLTVGLTLTTIINSWSSGVFYAIGVIASYLIGSVQGGFVTLRNILITLRGYNEQDVVDRYRPGAKKCDGGDCWYPSRCAVCNLEIQTKQGEN